MVRWDITVGDVTLDAIFDVSYGNRGSDELGSSTIVCGNNTNNRGIESGDEAVIKENGKIRFTGFVVGYPSKAGAEATELEIELMDKRAELKHESVNRVFYQFDTGEIVKRLVNKKAEFLSERRLTFGDDLSDWESDADVLELGEIQSKNLNEKGNDFIFAGWRQGTSGTQKLTFTDVPSFAVPGEKYLDSLHTRLLSNLPKDQLSVEIELYTEHGTHYVWTPDVGNAFGFATLELSVENASPNGELTEPGTLEYRFDLSGEISEPRAVAIDYATTIPFYEVDRDTSLDTGGVETTGRVITRRFDKSALSVVQDLELEDSFLSYVDANDTLHYEPSQRKTSKKSIDYTGDTPVVDAEFNRDFRHIKNEVTVQGSGNIQVRVRDEASIDFYGLAPRSEPVSDRNIQTNREAKQRGRGFLAKNAWDDVAMEFVIADASYSEIGISDEIYINWPPENIVGEYTVSTVDTDKNGFVTIGVTSSNAA